MHRRILRKRLTARRPSGTKRTLTPPGPKSSNGIPGVFIFPCREKRHLVQGIAVQANFSQKRVDSPRFIRYKGKPNPPPGHMPETAPRGIPFFHVSKPRHLVDGHIRGSKVAVLVEGIALQAVQAANFFAKRIDGPKSSWYKGNLTPPGICRKRHPGVFYFWHVSKPRHPLH